MFSFYLEFSSLPLFHKSDVFLKRKRKEKWPRFRRGVLTQNVLCHTGKAVRTVGVIQPEPGVYGDGIGQKRLEHGDAHRGVHL